MFPGKDLRDLKATLPRRLQPRRPVPALLLVSLWAASSAAIGSAELERELAPFLERSADADDAELDALARSFNVHQMPALAAGLSWAEVDSGPTAHAYEALLRWQFWMGRNLDPENQGMWSVARRGLDGRPLGRRIAAGVAAAELQQLRALAQMAQRRGHSVDALAFWRDHRILRRRLLDRLFEPATGVYADADSTGRRGTGRPSLASVATIGSGAPSINEATVRLLRGLLQLDDDAAADALKLAVLVDPRSGWGQGALAEAIGPDLFAFYLQRALEESQEGLLQRELRDALASHGFESRNARLRMGALEIEIPGSAFSASPFERSAAALSYLARTDLIAHDEADMLLAMLPAPGSGAVADSVTGQLLAALVRWKSKPLVSIRRSVVGADDVDLPPPNGHGRTAFRYTERDEMLWADQALQALTQDLLEDYLRPDRDSGFDGTLGRLSLAAGERPTLVVAARSSADVPLFRTDGWSARWSDGIVVKPGSPIQFETTDVRRWTAKLPFLPDELGVWWLIATNGKQRLRHAPGISVVNPIVSQILPLGAPAADGSQDYELSIQNNIDQPLELSLDVQHPESWELLPGDLHSLRIAGGTRHALRLQVRPEEGLGPGAYPSTWSLRRDGRLVQSEERKLAIPYQWIWLGGFPYDAERGLSGAGPKQGLMDLTGRFSTVFGRSSWKHLPGDRILPEGWVEIVPASAPAGVYYAVTALSSQSREISARVEANNELSVDLNGTTILRCEDLRREHHADAVLRHGTNHILVRMRAGGGVAGRFRLMLDDIEGEPLKMVENRLERLMDDYAYLRGSTSGGDGTQREERYMLIPIVYQSAGAKSVSVVGSFNGWSPTATPMVDVGGGKWRAEIRLGPGQFEYKLAVDGARWIVDPSNPIFTADGFGGRNSLLVLE
jgi:hypothetical protein